MTDINTTFVLVTPAWLQRYPRACLALQFAAVAHEGQFRKYTGEPYVLHPLSVMTRLYNLYRANGLEVPEDMLCAAALHDTVEDTEVTFQELTAEFGPRVAGIVFWLTDVCPKEWGNRATRKRLECERLRYAPLEPKIIKKCDIDDNTDSIEQHDAKFAATYVPEKRRMLDIIGDIGHMDLLETIGDDSCYVPVL